MQPDPPYRIAGNRSTVDFCNQKTAVRVGKERGTWALSAELPIGSAVARLRWSGIQIAHLICFHSQEEPISIR